MPNAEDPRTATTIAPSRREVILQRLQQNFYDRLPAADRVASAVLTDLKTLDERSSELSG